MPLHSRQWGADYIGWKGTAKDPMGEGWLTVQDHAIFTILDQESWSFWRGIHLTQGGLSNSEPASKGTHAGLGACDMRVIYNTKAEIWKIASMFLRSGIVYFPRGYNSTSWNPFKNTRHGHLVSRESYDSLAYEAQKQYKEYDAKASFHGDGLVGSYRYTGPSTPFERWATSPYNPINITEDSKLYTVDVSSGFLWGLDVDRKKMITRDKGETVQAAKQVRRWGRQNVVTPEGNYFALDYLKETA